LPNAADSLVFVAILVFPYTLMPQFSPPVHSSKTMDTDQQFRIAVLGVIVVATTIAVYHRVRAASGSPPVSRGQEGMLLGVTLRLGGGVLWLSTVAYLVAPSLVQAASTALPISIRWVGVAISALGLMLMQWTLTSLGKNLTDTVATRHNATLITHGPYKWVRHPYYVAAALLIVATTLISTNLIIAISGLIVLLLLAIRTPQEEQMLLQRFGTAYKDYQANTGRFVPKPRKRAG
jgi:protein-S-isoprenylcysteine O-methyltransferase Ste14